MKIDVWTLVLQAINALVLIWLLSRVLYRPVTRVIAERREAAARVLTDAEVERASAHQEAQAITAQKAELAAGREAALKAAEAEAAAVRKRMLAAARVEVETMRQQARADLEKQRAGQEHLNERRAAALAIDIATRLLGRLPASARVSGFLDDLAASIRALPDTQREQLAKLPGPLQLAAPRPLTPEELASCTQAIQAALGHAAPLTPVVDPDLLAGLELRSRNLVVSNHLHADLVQMQRELSHADEHA